LTLFRFAHLWFLIGCVTCMKGNVPFDTSQSYRVIPLPAPKSLWEASSRTAWESEYAASCKFQSNDLVTLGDLLDAQNSRHLPLAARQLDKWNAGMDNLGTLLNLVNTII
jgi:hypothetical protein